ncbi:hypothetical protein B0A55_11060, partial [Friedmanniomyces simplex]
HTRNISADTQQQLAGLNLGGDSEAAPPAKPPRAAAPSSIAMPAKPSFPAKPEDAGEDEDDPFGIVEVNDETEQPEADAEDPREVSLQDALAKSWRQLCLEDRIVSWQSASLKGSRGSREVSGTRSSIGPHAAAAAERSETASLEVRPLTEANLREATVPSDCVAPSEREGRNGIRGRVVAVAGSIWRFLKKRKYE